MTEMIKVYLEKAENAESKESREYWLSEAEHQAYMDMMLGFFNKEEYRKILQTIEEF